MLNVVPPLASLVGRMPSWRQSRVQHLKPLRRHSTLVLLAWCVWTSAARHAGWSRTRTARSCGRSTIYASAPLKKQNGGLQAKSPAGRSGNPTALRRIGRRRAIGKARQIQAACLLPWWRRRRATWRFPETAPVRRQHNRTHTPLVRRPPARGVIRQNLMHDIIIRNTTSSQSECTVNYNSAVPPSPI